LISLKGLYHQIRFAQKNGTVDKVFIETCDEGS
jgi:hypothetical protein